MWVHGLIYLLRVTLLLSPSAALAAGDLMLFPTRAVFEKNRRSIQVDLTNTGREPGTYRISLQNKRMTETGEFVVVDNILPGELFADKIVQFSPRQVELAPGSGQTVRLVLRKPADLAPGEYRSHLVFTRIPNASTKSVDGDDSRRANEIGIRLKALVGVSIPIIVKHGEISAVATFSKLKLIKPKGNDPAIVEMRIERSGNASLYGDLAVKFVNKSGKERELTKVQGVAVYVPNPFRLIKLALQKEDSGVLTGGKLVVQFSERREAGGKVLSEDSIEIP